MVRTLLLFVLLFLSAAIGSAQSPEFRQISDLDNLPCNEIYDVYFDKKGFLWIGTEIGVFRYDGHHFRPFSPNKRSGQALTGFTTVNERLFVFNFLGDIFEAKGDSFIAIPVPKWVLPHHYSPLSEGFDGQLWLSGSEGVFSYDTETRIWTNRTPKQLSKDDFFNTRNSRSTKENIWFTSKKEVVRIGPGGYQTYPVDLDEGRIKTLNRHILTPGEGNVWLCDILDGSLLILRDSSFVAYPDRELKNLLKNKKLTNMKEFEGKLYFMLYDGLIIHDPLSKKSEWIFRDLPITDMELDPEGNLWFSTLGYGLLYCPSLEIRSYPNNRMGGSTYKFTYLVPDGKGGIYYSRLSGGIGRIPKEDDQMIEIAGPVQADISALIRDENGSVYTAFNNYVFEVEGNRLKEIKSSFPATKDILLTKAFAYLASSSGLHFGTSLRTTDPMKIVFYGWCRRLSRSGNPVQIWAGTTDGLYLVQKDSVLKKLFVGEGVQDILWVPEEKSLYCALLSGDIYKIADGTTTRFKKLKKPGQQVYRMRWYRGNLWLATSRGLGKINTSTSVERWFDIRDGLSANVIYDLLFQDDYLWLATGNGLQKLRADLEKNTASPLIYFRSLHLNDRPIDSLSIHGISTDHVQISFDILSYYSQGDYHLAYSFDGEQWEHLPAGQNALSLTNLPLDAFHLLVRAIDAKGLSSATVNIPLFIRPPFWQSTWFYIAQVVLTFGIMLLIFRIYLRQVRRKQANALEKAKLKTNLIESQLTALKAQMNPHFIFNSLNSIYELIIFSETKEAATYLNKFATLLRKVLENSEKESITLTEECEWLNLYLELEKLRFGNDFSYQISMEHINEPYTVLVPTMLLQPFVENAVKHGLLHKQGIKRLEIEFSEEGNGILCLITDNGVGRKKASTFRKSGKEHKSFATGAIIRRINMLNASGKYAIQLDIEDLEYPNGKAAGTQVRLVIQGW
ncbi:MAG: sensor histidine kinase [Bacteroidia bacterium]